MATASISTVGRTVRDRFNTRRENDLEKGDEASRRKIHSIHACFNRV